MASKRVSGHHFCLRRFVSCQTRKTHGNRFDYVPRKSYHPREYIYIYIFLFFSEPAQVILVCFPYVLGLYKVNNVGTCITKPTTEFTEEDMSFMMATNLESAFHLSQLAHPLLKASGSGSMVFMSSTAGIVHINVGSIYGATKGTVYIFKQLTIL